jgi:hypothetical protein
MGQFAPADFWDLNKVTALILNYNEVPNVAGTLDRLSCASRVVVIDSYSTKTWDTNAA